MNLHMTGHHLEITPSMRDYVATKMTRINRHFDHVIDVNMILTVEKLRQRIEANVHLSGKDIFVESADADMYAAIDLLVDKLDRQIVKHKEKTKSRHVTEAPKRAMLTATE
jgi:putative sigma-54 modulation protein